MLAAVLVALVLATAPSAWAAQCPSIGVDSHPNGYVLTTDPDNDYRARLIAPDCSVTTIYAFDRTPFTSSRRRLLPLPLRPFTPPPFRPPPVATKTALIIDKVVARVHAVPSRTKMLIFEKCPTFVGGADLTNAIQLENFSITDCPAIETLDNVKFPEGVWRIDVVNTNLKSIKNVTWPYQLTALFLGSNKLTTIESDYPQFLTTLDLSGNPATTLGKGSIPEKTDGSLVLTLPDVTSIKGVTWPPLKSLTLKKGAVTEFEVRESDLDNVSKAFKDKISQSTCSDPTASLRTVNGNAFCVISDERFDAKYRSATPSPAIFPSSRPSIGTTNGPTASVSTPRSSRPPTLTGSGSGSDAGSVGDDEDDILLPNGKSGVRGRNPAGGGDTQSAGDSSTEGTDKDGSPLGPNGASGTQSTARNSSTTSAKSPNSPNSPASDDGDATESTLSSSTVTRVAVIAVISALVVLVLFLTGYRRRSARRNKGFDNDTSESPVFATFPATPQNDSDSQPLVGFHVNDVRNDAALEPFCIPASDITVGATIARGGFGVIYRGVYRDRDVAIKQMQPGTWRNEAALTRFMDEIRLCAKLNHSKIVEFVGISWTSLRDLAVVSEFMNGGDLHDALRKQSTPSPVDWTQTWSAANLQRKTAIAHDVAEAVVYLHSRTSPVLHRDLKARNVLLDERGHAKLSDFGISREVIVDETLTSEVGTAAWIAPEVLRGERYSAKADIYSFGVLLVEMDLCRHPYDARSGTGEEPGVGTDGESVSSTAAASLNAFENANIILLVSTGKLRPVLSSDCPDGIKTLAEECLSFDPMSRPTAGEVAQRLEDMLT